MEIIFLDSECRQVSHSEWLDPQLRNVFLPYIFYWIYRPQ